MRKDFREIPIKPKLRVTAFNAGWSFSFNGRHVGVVWYSGKIGQLCQEVLNLNKHLQ
jgi:hypothetical protein